jgi:hypothetical protein
MGADVHVLQQGWVNTWPSSERACSAFADSSPLDSVIPKGGLISLPTMSRDRSSLLRALKSAT